MKSTEPRSATIKEEIRAVMSEIEIEYIAVVNRKFKSLKSVEIGNSIILVAGRVGKTRLIDNIWV
jgi:pantoate--beta-alanine ligase